MRKYRLFGVINPVDILIVVAIIALVRFAYIFSTPQPEISEETAQLVRYTIELGNREEGFYRTIEPGAYVFSGARNINIGRVVQAYALDFLRDIPCEATNTIRRVPVEGREFTYIVIETLADVDDYSASVGYFEIAVNMPVYIRSRDFAGGGFIIRVAWDS